MGLTRVNTLQSAMVYAVMVFKVPERSFRRYGNSDNDKLGGNSNILGKKTHIVVHKRGATAFRRVATGLKSISLVLSQCLRSLSADPLY